MNKTGLMQMDGCRWRFQNSTDENSIDRGRNKYRETERERERERERDESEIEREKVSVCERDEVDVELEARDDHASARHRDLKGRY